MRVALITDEPYFTGIGKYSHNLYLELRKQGVDVDFYYLGWSSHTVDMRIEEGRLVRPFPFSLPFGTPEALVAHHMRNSLFPKDYDVYHAAQQFLINVLPDHGKRVATVHDLKPLVIPEDFPFVLRRYLKRIVGGARNLDTVLTDSESTKSDVMRLFGVPEGKLRVVPLGKSDQFVPRKRDRKELGLPEMAKVLMHVGTEDSSKNIPFLLQILKELTLKLSDVVLVRVGSKRRSTDNLIRKLSLQKNIVYVNGISDEILSRYYSSADLLVYPSRYEGFGLPPLEAMASGCPVVCSNVSSLPEVVGGAGLLLPLDAHLWNIEISALIADENALRWYRRLGLERAKEFSWPRCARQTIQAYREATG